MNRFKDLKGYNRIKIGDLAEVITGGTPSTRKNEYWDNGTIPWLPSGECQDKEINSASKFITEEGMKNSAAKLMPKSTVVIALTGATTGKTGILNIEATANQSVTGIVPNNKFISKYIFYYLRSIREKILHDSYGGAQKHISQGYVKDIEVLLPSLETQKKIVNILEKAEKALEKRKESIKLLDELVKSKFIDMFGDLNSNSKGWNIFNFNEFAVIDTNMTKDFEKYANYPHIGIDSIEKNTGNILEYQLVKDSSLKSGKYLFDERHIIYSKIRPNLNKVALPQFKGVCSADAYPILCLDGIVDRNYLGYVLRSEFFLSYILAFSGRTNIPKVNKEQLKGFNMPIPPIKLQNQFSDFVNQVDKLKFEMENSLKELEDNFNSLMQKAFKGELFN